MDITALAEKIYVISLPHRQDRREELTQNWSPLGLSWEYVDGVIPDPSSILWSEMRGLEAYGNPINLRNEYVIGAVGCKRAGIKALRTFLDSGHQTALICQDDCRWLPEWRSVIEPLTGYPEGWDMIYLSANLREPSLPHDDQWLRMVGARLCTSIIWNRRSALAAVEVIEKSDCEWDMAQEQLMRASNAYSPHRWVCVQARSYSDIVRQVMDQPNT